jgi:riboflavin synthase
MFTGLVQKMGELATYTQLEGGARLWLTASPWDPPPAVGESIAVQGICLTLTEVRDDAMRFDLLKETLDRTSLREKKVGDRLNLERALRVGDAVGGHFLTGHVDGTGRVKAVTPQGTDWILEVECSRELMLQMVTKGSISIDGVSLTIVDLRPTSFTVHLIPHTWKETTLSTLKPGQAVNLETDMIGKYVARYLQGLE